MSSFVTCQWHSSDGLSNIINMVVQMSEYGTIDKVSLYVWVRRITGICTALRRKEDVKFPVNFSSSDVISFTYEI
jgi:hypothetical protein